VGDLPDLFANAPVASFARRKTSRPGRRDRALLCRQPADFQAAVQRTAATLTWDAFARRVLEV